jgi:NOL1/NOP2/fmu family ribosome biogenesis protein
VLTIPVSPEWHIQGSLLPSFHHPVYRFIPGITRGEGLFMCVLQNPPVKNNSQLSIVNCQLSKNVSRSLNILHDGRSVAPTVKGKKVIPAHAESLLISTPRDKYPRVELSLDDALSYLRHEALILPPDTPRGYVIVTYQDLPLGFVNNIGSRANNLYPKEWKIRMQGTR